MYSLRPAILLLLAAYGADSELAITSLRADTPTSPAQVWLTNPAGNKWLSQESDVSFQTAQSTSTLTIKVDGGIKYQQIEGFGAALTDSSAWLINQLPTTTRSALMQNLFSPSTGIGLNLVRTPMGATDVTASGNFSYDDMSAGQADTALANFSIQHDQDYIIPELKQALSINPSVKITATAWSPPGWMKTSGAMIGGTLKTGYETILANYYVKFIQAYSSAGVPITYVTPQNEPMGTPTWPGMFLSAYQETAVVNQMGSAFAANNLSTSILVWDHNWDVPSYPETIFSDSTASNYAVGTGWHVYSGSPIYQTLVHNDYPNKKTFLTEATGGIWQANNNEALHDSLKTWIIDSTRNYANGVMLWNIALDPKMGPLNSATNGIPMMRPLVTIDPTNGTTTYNVDYYALAHASRFVKPGAYRIYSNTFGEGSIDDVAFLNPDESKVLIAHNSGTSSQTFTVADGTQMFSYTLPPNAGVTFTWSGPTQSGTTPAAGTVADPTHDFVFSGSATITYDPALLPLQNSAVSGSGSISYSLPKGASIQTGGTALSRTGWTVTASSGTSMASAIDGDLNTRWSNGHGLQKGDWFQLNLGSSQRFNQIVVDTGESSSFDYVTNYEVYVSSDGVSWGTPVATGAGYIGPVVITLLADQKAQYIRIVSTGTTSFWWSIGEINVYSATGTGSFSAPTGVANGLQLQSWTSTGGKAVTAVYNGTGSQQSFAVGSYTYTLPHGTSAMFTRSNLNNSGGTVPAAPAQAGGYGSGATEVTLSWQQPASDGGNSITGYKIDRATDSAFSQNLTTTNVSAVTSHVDTTVSANTTYFYRISAVNAAGASNPTATIQVKTPGATGAGPSRLVNIATRAFCGTGENVAIAGFVIGGAGTKRVLLRAVGPTLATQGISQAEVLADPTMQLYKGANVIASNDDWGTNENAAQIPSVGDSIGASGLAASDSKSAALLTSLEPGAYTFIVTGKNSSTGIVLLEVYDADTSNTASYFVNIATRAYSTTGSGVTIGGFVVAGSRPKQVLLRAVGPTLESFGISRSSLLADPVMEVHQGAPLIATNDNWGDNANAGAITTTGNRIGASAIGTLDTKSSVLLANTLPGAYTFIASGKAGTSGIVLVEVYDAD
jgi:O-glycosyl hydrolase